MRGVLDETSLLCTRGAERIQHRVETLTESAHLILPAHHDRRRKVSCASDGLRRLAEVLRGRNEPPGNEPASPAGHGSNEDPDESDLAAQPPHDGLGFGEVSGDL